jgi:hypothetical protein
MSGVRSLTAGTPPGYRLVTCSSSMPAILGLLS